jgi:hypothetical protein
MRPASEEHQKKKRERRETSPRWVTWVFYAWIRRRLEGKGNTHLPTISGSKQSKQCARTRQPREYYFAAVWTAPERTKVGPFYSMVWSLCRPWIDWKVTLGPLKFKYGDLEKIRTCFKKLIHWIFSILSTASDWRWVTLEEVQWHYQCYFILLVCL